MKKPNYFVQFCDDVRRDTEGKWILTGCYGSTILTTEFPASIPINIFVTIYNGVVALKDGTYYISVNKGEDNEFLSGGMIVLERANAQHSGVNVGQFSIPKFNIDTDHPTFITVGVSEDGEVFDEVGRMYIDLYDNESL